MKYLRQFLKFDWDSFSSGKEFRVTGIAPWQDYDTKAILGTTVEVVIYQDKTKYNFKNGDTRTNQFEKINFKIRKENVSIPAGTPVEPVNPSCTIYGDFGNLLSVKADDIRNAKVAKD